MTKFSFPTPESWAKLDEILKGFDKPVKEIEFFNIGGVYQLVDAKHEEAVRNHERMHALYRQMYRDNM